MQELLLDLRFVTRQLAKSPGFTVTAVLMLAFGIGATTAIFSLVEAVLLRPLPFPDSGRLMVLGDKLAGVNDGWNGKYTTVPDVRTYTQETHSFSALGGYAPQDGMFELSGTGEPARVNGTRMTAGVFTALGVAAQLGRVFTAKEDENNQQVTVLSYAAWVNRFHRDPRILGTKILLDRKPYIVIGVMPPNFEFPLVMLQPTSFSYVLTNSKHGTATKTSARIFLSRGEIAPARGKRKAPIKGTNTISSKSGSLLIFLVS